MSKPVPQTKQPTSQMSSPNPIESLLNQLSDAQARAATDLDLLHPSVRGGWVTAKRSAADEVEALTAQVVRQTIPSRLGGVFLPVGTEEDVEVSFGDHVVEVGGVLFDAMKLYRDLATLSQLPEVVRGRVPMRWGVDDYVRLIHAVEDFCGQEVSVPNLQYNPPPCEDLSSQQVLDIVQKTVEGAVGKDLIVVAARRHVFKEVLERRLANSMIPVLVIGADDRTMRSLEPLFRRKARVTPPTDFAGSSDEIDSLLSPILTT